MIFATPPQLHFSSTLRPEFQSSMLAPDPAAGFFTLGGGWVPLAQGMAAVRNGHAVLVGGLLIGEDDMS